MKLYAGTTEQFRARCADASDRGEAAGNTSRRLDAMLTGHSPTTAENPVVVKLKQWSDGSIDPSNDTSEVRFPLTKRPITPGIPLW